MSGNVNDERKEYAKQGGKKNAEAV
ncbi:hypothetical protein A2U01_0086597, partial [Trifolium medium]|nr:hypothetical protein [Trifolium medium]